MNKISSILLFSAYVSLFYQRVDSINATIEIDWDLLEASDYQSAVVGDTVEFNWNGTRSIFFIQPETEGCNSSNLIEIVDESSVPPVLYTFTSEDAYNEIVFASNISNDCQANESITFSVNPAASDRLTDCDGLNERLEQCLADAGVGGAGRFACKTCVSTSVTGASVSLGLGKCQGDEEAVCSNFVKCPCPDCQFEAVSFGSCEMDTTRGDDCPITDCSEQLATASCALLIATNNVAIAVISSVIVSVFQGW